jgi:hypothetical protein
MKWNNKNVFVLRKTKLIIIYVLKLFSTICVYFSFNENNLLHTMPAITCSVALFMLKTECKHVDYELVFLSFLLILIPLGFSILISWKGTLFSTLIFYEVRWLVIDALISIIVERIIWKLHFVS